MLLKATVFIIYFGLDCMAWNDRNKLHAISFFPSNHDETLYVYIFIYVARSLT